MVALPGAVSSPRGAALEAWPARRGQGTETAVRGLRPRTAANRSGRRRRARARSPPAPARGRGRGRGASEIQTGHKQAMSQARCFGNKMPRKNVTLGIICETGSRPYRFGKKRKVLHPDFCIFR